MYASNKHYLFKYKSTVFTSVFVALEVCNAFKEQIKTSITCHGYFLGSIHAFFCFDSRLTYSIYRVVSVALFANHQLTFSFMLCSSIMRANDKYEDVTTIGKITDFDWSLFLQGNILANMMDEKVLQEHDGKFNVICE